MGSSATQKDEQNDNEQQTDGEETEQMNELQNKLETMESELKKYKDALARSHADIVNIQNMNKKDVENARKFATKSFSKDILSVADSLQGCLNVVEQQQDMEVSTDHIKSVIDGVKVT